MSFRKRLKYFLVHEHNCTNEQAQNYINEGRVKINNVVIADNPIIQEIDNISLDNAVIQKGVKHQYILFYKPKGIETTHNTDIENSFAKQFPELKDLFFAGRLDKDSEGLLFLTSNGKLVHNLAHPLFQKEKEYIVTLNKKITNDFKVKMESGITILGKTTQPCSIEIINENTFKILLKEGKNRQIRRMCYKLNYEVVYLKRTKIENWSVEMLQPGEYRNIDFIP